MASDNAPRACAALLGLAPRSAVREKTAKAAKPQSQAIRDVTQN